MIPPFDVTQDPAAAFRAAIAQHETSLSVRSAVIREEENTLAAKLTPDPTDAPTARAGLRAVMACFEGTARAVEERGDGDIPDRIEVTFLDADGSTGPITIERPWIRESAAETDSYAPALQRIVAENDCLTSH